MTDEARAIVNALQRKAKAAKSQIDAPARKDCFGSRRINITAGDPSLLKRLWPAEQATCIDIASKSTGWNATKIVNAPGVRAIVKSRPPRPAGIRHSAKFLKLSEEHLFSSNGPSSMNQPRAGTIVARQSATPTERCVVWMCRDLRPYKDFADLCVHN